MEVTWQIRPGIAWHDGRSLVVDDFVFGYQVIRDPELAVENRAEIPNVSEVRALDDRTVVVTWKTQTIRGNTNNGDGIPAVPRHLLRDLYLTGDKTAFTNSPTWNVQWVGIGPYRLDRWERGSLLEASAFDRYFLGRPKIDRIVIHYLGDANAMVANVLAGSVDVITLGAQLDIGQVVVIREEWAAKGGIQARPNPYPTGAATEVASERRATPKGGVMWPWNFESGVARRLIASEIRTPDNRYRGGNYSGFSSPVYEALYSDLTNTLDPARYRQTQFQMVKFMADELPLLPVFYTPLGLVARPGIEGPGLVSPLQPSNTWNIHMWDLR